MTTEIVARASLIAGAVLLVIGPGMQARLQMREYHDMLDTLIEGDPPAVTREYLSLLAVGPSMALHSPLGLIRFLAGAWGWYPRYRAARRAFMTSEGAHDTRVADIRTHLVRARNWAIVVAGSVLILVGTSVELAQLVAG